MKEEYLSHSPAETERIAEKIAETLGGARFLALYGEMGAGKTAFVRGLARALCPESLPLVHSPTFAIVNEYGSGKLPIFHFDLYRIRDYDDLYSTGFYDFAERGGLIVTEWSELFEEAIPPDALRVRIEKRADETRLITVRKASADA